MARKIRRQNRTRESGQPESGGRFEGRHQTHARRQCEKWDTRGNFGEYGVVVGDRYTVKVSGNAASIDELKAAVASVNLAGLDALKNQGVAPN